jgi:chemosensory pili system protein ChpA (sensor histidine kinase/response regulator)
MIPVSVLVPRLERTVREACRAANKKARIYVEGEHLLADTDIIGGLRDALMHMLRNSVDHGIEAPAERLEKLKSEEGRIDISFRRQGNTILIRVLDDGGGFDIDRIRATAAKRGLELGEDLPDSEVLRLVLMPGFSTKGSVTTLSGRGIGMDVVRQSVEDLGGSVVLVNRPEGGAETTIRLPLTLVSAPVLLVRLGGQRFAIPSDDVNQILYPGEDSIYHDDKGWRFRLGDERFEIRSFASLIGRGSDEREFRDYTGKTVLLIQQDTGMLALLLDKAEESRDVVVQQLGPWLQGVKGVAGACILANGDVAPIMDMRALLRGERERSVTEGLERDFFENYFDEEAARKVPLIMVVDDSLSARKSLEIAVDSAGYEVVPAIDGLDAISQMDGKMPDLILADMEMPKMNGLELTTHVRAQPETQHIPVVMITSRSTKKHRDRAMTAGVSHYLTKPFDQDQLHGIMEELLREKRPELEAS